ncbi:MAG: HGxxPAAW family protein [Nocardioides sp.]|uniref:HGxxPAAW family protein n=1 Tax=Nocardioides sp. TaxID=35761 RepID=UPI0039E2EA3B
MAHHGNTPAAWTGVALSMLGFVLGGIALMIHPFAWPLFWIGVVLVLGGWVVYLVMAKLGYNT